MYNRKRLKRKYWTVGIIIAIVLLLIGIIIFFQNKNNSSFVLKIVKDGVLFTEKIVMSPIKFVQKQFIISSEKKDLYNKYKDLESQINNSKKIESENVELKKQLDEMKKTLDLNNTLVESTYLNATVVNRNLDYWNGSMTIDKGSSSGVKLNQAVVIKDGLIGRISHVSHFNSTVELLTNSIYNKKISVKIKINDLYVYGLLKGYNDKNKTYIIEGISENIQIPLGSDVTTTGMSDTFPAGIIIGKVFNVTTDNFDLAKVVEVKSSVNFNSIDFVTILNRVSDSQ